MMCNFIFYDRQVSVSANDGAWHHICASWEHTAGSLQFYKDGILSASETNFKTGHVIRSAGSLMLAQKQDSVGGGLDSTQSFQGFLSNLNVWDYVVCPEIIAGMSKACLSGEGNVHEWSHFKHSVVGVPRLFIPSPCESKGKRSVLHNEGLVKIAEGTVLSDAGTLASQING